MNEKQERAARVAILGCGVIGESWAGLMTAHGVDVTMWDPHPGNSGDVRDRIERISNTVRGISSPATLPPSGSLSFAPSLQVAVEQADLVQENAPENIELKRTLYSGVERYAPDQTIIASSTSSLTWSELSSGLASSHRLVTAHPFNPPHIVPLVEIYGTDLSVVQRAVDFYSSLGRSPVVLQKDASGHIANRLASALWREAVNIVAEGIADVATVDKALVDGPGLRWAAIGAHMAYHLGGGAGGIEHYLKHLGPSQERRWQSLGSPTLDSRTRSLLIDGVQKEAAGRSIRELEEVRDQAMIAILQQRMKGLL